MYHKYLCMQWAYHSRSYIESFTMYANLKYIINVFFPLTFNTKSLFLRVSACGALAGVSVQLSSGCYETQNKLLPQLSSLRKFMIFITVIMLIKNQYCGVFKKNKHLQSCKSEGQRISKAIRSRRAKKSSNINFRC